MKLRKMDVDHWKRQIGNSEAYSVYWKCTNRSQFRPGGAAFVVRVLTIRARLEPAEVIGAAECDGIPRLAQICQHLVDALIVEVPAQ
jgi:hypothetical protein